MATFDELPLTVRAFLAAYRWQRIDPVPWTPLRKPLAETKVALISTAGLVLPEQPRFDPAARGGDATFREIAATADPRTLVDAHRSDAFDHAGIEADPSLAFPLDRLRELAEEGTIGGVTARHFSFMGSITRTAPLCRESAPEVARRLGEEGAEAVLLVPV